MAAFDYANWPALPTLSGPDYVISDAPSITLFDGEHHLQCQKPCEITAPTLAAALEGLEDWIRRLYDQGRDLTGPMRFRVFEHSKAPRGVELQPWPLQRSPEEALDPTFDPTAITGPAAIVSSKSELSALRESRASIGSNVVPAPAFAAHEDPNRSYMYVFRDQTAFEDSDGRIPGLK